MFSLSYIFSGGQHSSRPTTLGHFLLGTFYFLHFPFIFFGFVVRFVAPSDTFHVAKQTNDNCAPLFIVYLFCGTVRAIKEAARLYSVSLVTVRIRNILSALRVTLKNSRHCVAPRVVINCGSHTRTHSHLRVCLICMRSALVISTAPESMQHNNKFGYTSHAQHLY